MQVGDLAQSFTMEDRVQVRSFWVQDEIEVPTSDGMGRGDAFATFVRLPANHDDEWGLFMVGVAIGPEFDGRLATHREAVAAMWEKMIHEGDDDEAAFQLRRNIAFGASIGRIAKDPAGQAAIQDIAISSLSELQKDLLKKLPVEVVRHMRDTFRTGGRRAT